jgi:hypothetical protein
MMGVLGTFSASDTLAPIYGILLGPYIDAGSIVIGTFLAIAFGKSVTFLGLDFLPATVAAISLGFLIQRRFRQVIALFILLLGLFLANPLTLIFVTLPNGVPVPFNWLHLVTLAVLVSPLSRRAVDWVTAPSPKRLLLGFAVLCFIGTMMQHVTGGFLFESVLGLALDTIKVNAWPGLWMTIFYAYPFERLVFTVVSALIGPALITTLRPSNVILISHPDTSNPAASTPKWGKFKSLDC